MNYDYQKIVIELRNKLVISQTELADMLGISFATLNRWEGGKFEPSSSGKRKLAPYFKMYGIEVED